MDGPLLGTPSPKNFLGPLGSNGLDFSKNEVLVPKAIEKIKILGGILELLLPPILIPQNKSIKVQELKFVYSELEFTF